MGVAKYESLLYEEAATTSLSSAVSSEEGEDEVSVLPSSLDPLVGVLVGVDDEAAE